MPKKASASVWYCLDPKHPGSLNLLDDTRFFESDEDGCPTCPACGKQVSAIPADAKGTYPADLLNIASRLV